MPVGQTRRLPLWKNCLDNMRKGGLEFGKQFSATFFEEQLGVQSGTVRFGTDVSKIRDALLDDGFYLSGEGHNGMAFEIVSAAENHRIMGQMLREASRRTRQAVRLGEATPKDRLSQSERLRHEQVLERAQIRQALMGRAKSITRHLKKTAPKLLEKAQDDEA